MKGSMFKPQIGPAVLTVRALLLALAVVGCGEVTSTTQGLMAPADGAAAAADAGTVEAPPTPPELAADAGTVEAPPELATDAGPAAETAPAACVPADGCPSCVGAGQYATAQRCRDVIDCVAAGGVPGYGYPWQSCQNKYAGSNDGVSCAQALVKACP
jgi:hypothetical protein